MADLTIKTIDFANLGGPLYSGRPRGELAREKLQLDLLDTDNDVVVDVIIPEQTYSVTSSFFLGMFGKSVRVAGSRDAFRQKYRFNTSEHMNEKFDDFIDRAVREKGPLI